MSATALAAADDRHAGATYSLTVKVSGDGRATSEPTGIDCGSDCDHAYASGTSVTVTGRPGPGATHTCINGCIEGSDSVTVVMDRDREIKVTFQKITPQGPAPSPTATASATATPTSTPAFEPELSVVELRRYAVALALRVGTDAQATVRARVRVAGRTAGTVSRGPIAMEANKSSAVRLRVRGKLRRRVVKAMAVHPRARIRLRVAAGFTHGADRRTVRRRVTLPR